MEVNIVQRNHVKVTGSGPVTLLFAHGFGCDQHTWRAVLPAFESRYQIVVFDYVGAGQSDLSAYDEQRYSTLEGYAQDVVDICKALHLTEVIFIGHSVSSMIGLLAAVQHPSLFRKIVFIGPSPRYINDEAYYGGMELPDLEALLEVMESNYLGWSKNIAPAIMGNPDRPHLGEKLAESFCQTDPEIAKKFARVTFLSDNRKDLPQLRIPSLTIQCDDDILASPTVAEYIREHTPGNEMILLNSGGHCPHLSDPQGVIQAIQNFICV